MVMRRPSPLSKKHVVLGVTGSVAAYKAAEIVRLLSRIGIQVRVVMTRAGARLMSAETLASLTSSPVLLDLFEGSRFSAEASAVAPPAPSAASGAEGTAAYTPHSHNDSLAAGFGHIELANWGDLFLIAPATANVLAKAAAGLADDALTTTLVAFDGPVVFAPAMNAGMWANRVVQKNRKVLEDLGCRFVGPQKGDLACGEEGWGRMADPEAIVDAVVKLLLESEERPRVLITAGPTFEPLDAVRVLANRSSGKMGVALAEAARDRGYQVVLVAGPMAASVPPGVELVRVESAEEMRNEVLRRHADAEILVMAAAVADYRPEVQTEGKVPSGQEGFSIPLVSNPDILAEVAGARQKKGFATVGFALEVGDGALRRAREKMKRKGADLIVLNDATGAGSKFGGDTLEATLLWKGERTEPLGLLTKREVAERILDAAESLLAGD